MTGTKSSPIRVADLSEAFDICREMNKPIWVSDTENNEELSKVFPSGYIES